MSSFAAIAKRVEEGLANNDDLFADMVALMPEVCAPSTNTVGCFTMLSIIGKTALDVESSLYSAEEAMRVTAKLNTCEKCPLKNFD